MRPRLVVRLESWNWRAAKPPEMSMALMQNASSADHCITPHVSCPSSLRALASLLLPELTQTSCLPRCRPPAMPPADAVAAGPAGDGGAAPAQQRQGGFMQSLVRMVMMVSWQWKTGFLGGEFNRLSSSSKSSTGLAAAPQPQRQRRAHAPARLLISLPSPYLPYRSLLPLPLCSTTCSKCSLAATRASSRQAARAPRCGPVQGWVGG